MSKPVLSLVALFVLLGLVADVALAGTDPLTAVAALVYAPLLLFAAFVGRRSLHVVVLVVHWTICLLPALGFVESPGW